MENMNEEMLELETILLPNEDGTETEYAILDTFDFEDKLYMVICQVEGDTIDDSETELLRYTVEGEEMILDSIEDDDEFNRAVAYYATL